MSYKNGVLQISTPLSVRLAEKRMSLGDLVRLVPGAMITFDERYDQPLTLRAGDSVIGTGETIKIGDKFGMRIKQIGPTE
ncbi:MAG: FliM/FliN family flagellar motor C-terminal domain-containing protein [Planctomycetota bacterium]